MDGINLATNMERIGHLPANDRLLFFKSDCPSVGLEYLYVGSYEGRGQPFSAPVLPSVNSATDEESIWVSPDLNYVVMSSGSLELYEIPLSGLTL